MAVESWPRFRLPVPRWPWLAKVRWLRVAGLVVVSALLLQVGLGVYLGDGVATVQRTDPGRPEPPGADAVKVTALTDQASLQAWYWPAGSAPARGSWDAVILLHGLGDDRAALAADMAPFLIRAGYAVLAPDSRGHGLSGGARVTYGLDERFDVMAWVRMLKERGARCVFGLGESLGAAVALQAARAGAGLCGIVAEGAFASFREIAYDRLGGGLGRTLLRPAVEIGLLRARQLGVDLERVAPVDAVRELDVPVLLIHGLDDRETPPRHSRAIEAACRSCELWLVEGAGHGGAHGRDSAIFERRVLDFFGRIPRRTW